MSAFTPRKASNARSPNRKPRVRGAIISYRRETAKENWLKHYGATGNFLESCISVGRSSDAIRTWMHNDEAFRSKWLLIREAKKMERENRLGDMTDKALEVYLATLEDTQDKRLAFEAARRLLVSEALLKEKTEVAQSGAVEHIIRIVREPLELTDGHSDRS